eukprot:TRINITY_DN81813_c0_g1_i10.p1 TRINITY_DN81813_c0_g1~~TRINITY_DN81813_c0_g1_i10.p1  ORF type:complete len:666 (-),score=112.26 TRINITY_DN81813_c0_g1_i10:715-2712(-)
MILQGPFTFNSHQSCMQDNDIPKYAENNEYENVPEQGPRGKASNQFDQQQPLEQRDHEEDENDAQDHEMEVDQNEMVQLDQGADTGEANPGDAVGQNAKTNRVTQWNQDGSKRDQRDRERKRQRPMLDVNPARNLADAIEHWKANLAIQHDANKENEDLDEQLNVEDDQIDHQDPQPDTAEEYQFLRENEKMQKGDTQTIASATKEQAQQFQGDLNKNDDNSNDGEDSDIIMAEENESSEDEEMEETEEKEMEITQAKTGHQGKSSKSMMGKGEMDLNTDKENQEIDKVQQTSDIEMNDSEIVEDGIDLDLDTDINQIHSYISYKPGNTQQDADTQQIEKSLQLLQMSEDRRDELRKQIEERIKNPNVINDDQMSQGREIWARCDALTAGLAGELAEQLRLVLEPQMASRLVGDYKSGKRINMKKVIQFIASRFRKDKIWMRRTKPNKRTYQVMLAIDDSRSMTENGCAPYALEALTLICKAMQRLEVGQLGLVSFGGSKGVQLLHSLEQPFNDSLGPQVLGQLGFDQDSTLDKQPMGDLMVTLQHLLKQAKQHSNSNRTTLPLHQLVLIVADGRLHERDSLRKIIRETSDTDGVMFVYIVVDNPKESVLDIKQVKFLSGGGISTDPYLDSFPFPYYILLRQISALPRTLAELLQQFFQHALAQQ